MKFGTGSNNELTQKYKKVKVQNDTRTSTHIFKQTHTPDFQLCYSGKCLARYARLPIKHYEINLFLMYPKECFILILNCNSEFCDCNYSEALKVQTLSATIH